MAGRLRQAGGMAKTGQEGRYIRTGQERLRQARKAESGQEVLGRSGRLRQGRNAETGQED
jgi:hypothetical protein